MSIDYENFHESLLHHLQKRGHGGQALVCRHTSIPRSYLSRIVKKERRAGAKTQRKIAKFFGLGLEEFAEIGRRITLGENPDAAVDLLGGMPEELLLQRLTAAVRKEIATSRQLGRTQLLYEDIVENSRQLIIRFDRELRLSFVNRAGERLTGQERSALLGLPWPELIQEEYRAELTEEVARLRQGGGSFSQEVQVQFNRTWLFLNVTVFPAGSGDGDQGQLVGFDLTERNQLLDRLRFIQHGVEMSNVPTLWIGAQAEIVYVNRAVCALLGYSRQELETMHVWDINPLIPEASWPERWAWFEKEENVVFGGQYRNKAGQIIPVEFRVSNLRYPDGRRYNVVFVRPLGEKANTESFELKA
ncbi:MAG: PAS domain S-box protein [Desulfobulbaceae bacterium]|nr:PAS domain S-box protein [Desulfobulbaceae bacterium]